MMEINIEMMKRHLKFLISWFLFSMVCLIHALAIDIKSTEFPMYPFSHIGKEKAQMKLMVDYTKYPSDTTEASFPILDRQIPECVFAEYIRLLMANKNGLTTFMNLHLLTERQGIEMDYGKLRQEWQGSIKEIKFRCRFDIGTQVYILYEFEFTEKAKKTGGFLPPGAEIILTKVGEDYFIGPTTINLGTPIDRSSLPWLLIGGITWDLPRNVLLNNYKYTLTIPSPVQGDLPDLHSMKVSFNGTIGKILIDENTKTEDEIIAFMKEVVLTYRQGSDEEWLSLWPKDEAGEWATYIKTTEKDEYGSWESMPGYGMERRRFDGKVFLLYKIDFGPNALVLYHKGTEVVKDKNGRITNVKILTFWKDSKGKFLLTSGSPLDINSDKVRFSDNIKSFFESQLFLNFLMKELQVKQ